MLDDPSAGRSHHDCGHRGDIDRTGSIATRSHDVDGGARHFDRGGEFDHDVGHAQQLGYGLPFTPQRDDKSGKLSSRGVTTENLLHGPTGGVRALILAADQAGQELGPARHRLNNGATAPGSRSGSIGCARTPSARDQVASQASSRRPVNTRIGGHLATSSLSWRHSPMPPGTASPSKMARSIPPPSIAAITAGWVATSTTRTGGRSAATFRPSASRTFSRTVRSDA